MSAPRIVVLEYGSGNVRSAVRALERAGAQVRLTADPSLAKACDGLVVPGVGAFPSVAAGVRAVGGDQIVAERLAEDRPVLGICVGLQVMFERSTEFEQHEVPGLAHWRGTVELLPAAVVPHMGWNTVEPAAQSRLFEGVERERFYFVHSYGVQDWPPQTQQAPAAVTWAQHGARFVAAVEHGPLSATQFHPEKSGAAGAQLLRNWLRSL